VAEVNDITYTWRGEFSNVEIHAVHAEAFETRLYDETEWDWIEQCARHSLGWVVARDGSRFVGFVNVIWDGLVHAYLEDVMVSSDARGRGVGVGLVHAARDAARGAGCEFLHVNFDEELRSFYIDACGFAPTFGGLMELSA
jgi:GNAT superfamily N-acetyltransferase